MIQIPNKKFYIGIDPGMRKSGIAVFETKLVSLYHLRTITLLNFIPELIKEKNLMFIGIEAAHKIKITHHKLVGIVGGKIQNKRFDNRIVGQYYAAIKTANSSGKNNGVSFMLCEQCHLFGIKAIEVIPTKSIGLKDKKKFLEATGWEKPSNEHTRDAAMIAIEAYKAFIMGE
jgi:hypothetical protein